MKQTLITLVFLTAYTSKAQTVKSSPDSVIYRFVKSITLGDTALFYSCIDAESLCENIKKTGGIDTTAVKKSNIYVIYFHFYAPWIILPAEKKKLVENYDSTCNFKLHVDTLPNNTLSAQVQWKEKNKIGITLKAFEGQWRVIMAMPDWQY